MRVRTKTIAGVTTAVMLLGAPAALAQSTAVQGYSTPGGVVQSQVGSVPSSSRQPVVSTSTPSPPAATTQAKSGSLPFTGLDIALVVGAGGLLVALGLGIRRLSRGAA